MSLFSRLTRSRIRTDDWKKAEGVLPVERALADEHEAMHGDAITPRLEAVTLEFDASQFLDVPALARDLRNAIGNHESPLARNPAPRRKLDSEATPRDAIGKFLLEDPALMAALIAFESAGVNERTAGKMGRPPAHDAFASALATAFNKRLGQRLMDEPACRPFVQSGAVDALGEAPAGSGAVAAQEDFYRRANRELLEAVFPRTVALMRDRRLAVVFDAARKRDTAALCLSGGGIRSSTFALGIMQGLARHGLLGKFDYLSTVSGGGLSGGWLSAWMRREGANTVHDALRTAGQEKLQPEPEPVQGLRAFSHWLTPAAGALSVDSWTVIATVLRNLLLNWLVLIPLLCGLIMLPRLLLAVLAIDFGARPSNYDDDIGWVILGGFSLILLASAYIEWVRVSGDEVAAGRRAAPTQAQVLGWFMAPLMAGSMVIVVGLWISVGWDVQSDTYGGVAILAVLLATVVVIGTSLIRRRGQSIKRTLGQSAKVLISGLVGYSLALSILVVMSNWEDEWQRGLYMTLGPAVVLLGSVITSQLYTGLTSNEASDSEREWSARANAWVLIVAIGWMVSSGLVLEGPTLVSGLWQKATLLGVGGLSTWLTMFLGKSTPSSAGSAPSAAATIRRAAISLAAPVFVMVLIIGLAAANERDINAICATTTLAEWFQCTPPTDDSDAAKSAAQYTSGPMFEILGKSQRNRVVQAGSRLTSLLMHDAPAPVNLDSATAIDAKNDVQILAADRAYTAAALAFDSLEQHRILRSAAYSAEMRETLDTLYLVRRAVRAFTFARNEALATSTPADSAKAAGNSPGSLIAQTERSLATRQALNDGMRIRARDTVALHELADSVLRSRALSEPGNHALWKGVLLLMIAAIGTSAVFSRIVNTNTFSLHALWKARTVRAFLGTTRASTARNPNPFTGFDADDDVSLRDLWPARVSPAEAARGGERSESVPPMHVLNVTLNLAAGRNLAWQQRKGESMTMTPLHAGSAFTGYRRMEPYANPGVPSPSSKPGYGGRDGVSLGTAMAISGAAVSPNDGAGTTAISAFLLTFFNARLGWWLGNPGAPGAGTWQRSAPKSRLTPILSEMAGRTSDQSEYVYLSDGGQFENLALYEMVFRRNRFILVSDAGADPNYTFEDLGNAVRKIRIDFGIPIEFDNPVSIGGMGTTNSAYWATARIKYSAVDMPQDAGCDEADYDGVLVYVKPAVYGKIEPRDVINYANLSPSFPQESSADQFFSESQFESYRALGSWIIDQLVTDPAAPGPPAAVTPQRPGSLLSEWPALSAHKSAY